MDPLVENLGKWVRIVFVMFTGRRKSWVIRLLQQKTHRGAFSDKSWGGENLGETTTVASVALAWFSLGGVLGWTGFELFAMMNIITACFVDSAPWRRLERDRV